MACNTVSDANPDIAGNGVSISFIELNEFFNIR